MYKIFGTNCVNHFEGMWAFAIFDKIRGFFSFRETGWEKNRFTSVKNQMDIILVQKQNLLDHCLIIIKITIIRKFIGT